MSFGFDSRCQELCGSFIDGVMQGSFVAVETGAAAGTAWHVPPDPLQASGAVFEMLRQQWLRERGAAAERLPEATSTQIQVRHSAPSSRSALQVSRSLRLLTALNERKTCAHHQQWQHMQPDSRNLPSCEDASCGGTSACRAGGLSAKQTPHDRREAMPLVCVHAEGCALPGLLQHKATTQSAICVVCLANDLDS